jgi:hypothetical protein
MAGKADPMAFAHVLESVAELTSLTHAWATSSFSHIPHHHTEELCYDIYFNNKKNVLRVRDICPCRTATKKLNAPIPQQGPSRV